MAQALKAGELVSVLKKVTVNKTDPAYAQGLKRLKAGQVGQVVGMSTGRSMTVDFGGKQISLPSRQLERVPVAVEGSVTGAEVAIEKSSAKAEAKQGPNSESLTQQLASSQPSTSEEGREDLTQPLIVPSEEIQSAMTPNVYAGINYNDSGFITAVANKLLIAGNDPNTLLIELRFNDLPLETRDQVEALIRAKLALGIAPKSPRPTVPKPGAKRRGRPSTKTQS